MGFNKFWTREKRYTKNNKKRLELSRHTCRINRARGLLCRSQTELGFLQEVPRPSVQTKETIFMYYMSLGFSGGGKTGVNKKKLVSICFQIMDMNNLAKTLIILTLFIFLVPLLKGEISTTQTNFKIFVSCPGKYSPLN